MDVWFDRPDNPLAVERSSLIGHENDMGFLDLSPMDQLRVLDDEADEDHDDDIALVTVVCMAYTCLVDLPGRFFAPHPFGQPYIPPFRFDFGNLREADCVLLFR